jgi:colanic acid biosynthesis protein WcaH
MAHKIPYDKFIEVYSLVPRLCVEIVIKTNQGVLLTKRNIPPAIGMWHLPGGTWLKDETAEEAAKRIALDELGIDISLGKLLGYVDFSPEVAVGHSISLVFLVRPASLDIRLNEQASEYQFFKQLPSETIPETKLFLEKNILNNS